MVKYTIDYVASTRVNAKNPKDAIRKVNGIFRQKNTLIKDVSIDLDGVHPL